MTEFMNFQYPIVGLAVAVVALVVGTVLAVVQSNDATDAGLGVMVAVSVALVAGLAWPLTLLTAAIAGPAMWWRRGANRRRAKAAAEASQREFAPKPMSDTEKYAEMAREQRSLAAQSRRNQWEDVAAMQEGLAEQYEALAGMYRRESA